MLVEPVAAATGTSVVGVAVAAALAFVAVSAAVLGLALHRWRLRTAEQLRLRRSPTELDHLRQMFLTAVSHELRTPVTNLVGYAETLRVHREELTPEQVDRLTGRLVANGERLERLVLDLLDLHPGGTAAHPPQRTALDLDELLPALVAEHADGERTVSVRSSVGQVLVEDRGIRRIVAELLDNVSRHTPAGTTASVVAARHGSTVLLVVEDDGPGLDPAIAGDVADPFVQGRDTASDPVPGLGIGLALVAHHAERHGGQLSLSRTATGGTRATVLLPAPTVLVSVTEDRWTGDEDADAETRAAV